MTCAVSAREAELGFKQLLTEANPVINGGSSWPSVKRSVRTCMLVTVPVAGLLNARAAVSQSSDIAARHCIFIASPPMSYCVMQRRAKAVSVSAVAKVTLVLQQTLLSSNAALERPAVRGAERARAAAAVH